MSSKNESFTTFLSWLVFAGLCLFALFIVWEKGWLSALWQVDLSHLSLVIFVFFMAATIFAGYRAFGLSRELKYTEQFSEADVLNDNAGRSVIAHHFQNLKQKAKGDASLLASEQSLLLEALEHEVFKGLSLLWFSADLMIKLGLLGTVIGFIYMLGSVTGIEQIDINNVQQLLVSMSAGMRVALFTTLCGLVAGILIAVQHQLLEHGAKKLLRRIIEISETRFLPALVNVEK